MIIDGTANNDTLNGTAGDDTINGLAGSDTLNGLEGNDILNGGIGTDTMNGGAGDDSIVITGVSDPGYEVVNGGTGFDSILGSADDDIIRLWNYTGANTVERIDGGAGLNVIAAVAAFGTVLNFSGTELLNIARIEGGAGGDTITGSSGNDLIVGGAGFDNMNGGGGDDTFEIFGTDASYDVVNGGPGFDRVLGSTDDDTFRLWNYSGANTVELIDGGTGLNVIAAVANFATVLDFTNTQLVGITRIEGGAAGDTIRGGTGDDVILGAAGNDTLRGNAGNDSLDGGTGADSMQGGTGDDIYYVDAAGDVVTESAGQGTDTVNASIDYTLPANVENLNLTSAALNATGNSLANTISGNALANTINGDAGNDALSGGGGNDLYVVNAGSGQDVIADHDAADGNTDTIRFGTGFAPETVGVSRSGLNLLFARVGDSVTVQNWYGSDADKIERVEFAASATVWEVAQLRAMTNLAPALAAPLADQSASSGQAFSFQVPAGAFADPDSEIGDTLSYSAALANGDPLPAWLNFDGGTRIFSGTPSPGDAGSVGVSVTATDTQSASAFDVFDLAITGSTGVINGTPGNDTLVGTTGNETINGLEGNDTLSGLEGDDTLNGGTGNDSLDGGPGVDALEGGPGNDTYYVDVSGDSVIESPGAGTDTVYSALTYTLGPDIENLTITGIAPIDGTGNSLSNTIIGNVAANQLSGLDGNDVLLGESGDDRLDGGAGADVMVGGPGNDTFLVADVSDQARESTAIRIMSSAEGGTQGNLDSGGPAISADGRYVAFVSNASNLVPGDTNNKPDVFVRDLVTGTIERVSVAADGIQEANQGSSLGGISADGRYVVFSSIASNLIAGDTNGSSDVFVKDRVTGAIERASVSAEGSQVNGQSSASGISPDGRYVLMSSGSSTLVAGDTNAQEDVFVKDRLTGDVYRASIAADGTQPNSLSTGAVISADGRFVAFTSYASNLVPGDTNSNADIFVKDLTTGTLERVSVAADGSQTTPFSAVFGASISADGRYVAFESDAGNLVPGDTTVFSDIFVKDRLTGEIERVSTSANGAAANNDSESPQISGDGRYVVFHSLAQNLVPDAGGTSYQVYVKDLVTGSIEAVSVNASDAHGLAGHSHYADISADGKYVVFDSSAPNLIAGDTNGRSDVFVNSNALSPLVMGGIDTVESSITFVLERHIENLLLTGIGDTNGTGNALDNMITGNSSDNVLNGGAGIDTLIGGPGNDTYVVESTTDTVIENAGEGADTVLSSVTYSIAGAANLENVTLNNVTLNFGSNNATGNDGNNVLTGNDSTNVLDGGAGIDTLIGGLDNDTYVVDSTTDMITENADGGTDTVQSSVTYSIAAAANLENVILTGAGAINATGNALANLLIGNSASNTLTGGAGADILIGVAGNDLYFFDTGSGHDVISDYDSTAGNQDVVRFGIAIAPASVGVSRSGLNLVLAQGADTVTVQNWFASDAYKIERVEFTGDATVWDAAQLRALSNFAPTLANPLLDQAASSGQAFAYNVPADAYSDPDSVIGDTLSYAATLANGDPLPAWLAFTAGTRSFSGTPGAGDAGLMSVRVTATDTQGAFASDLFDLSVNPPTATNLTQTKNYLEDAVSVSLDDIVVSDVDSGETIAATLTLANTAAGSLTTSGSASYDGATGVWTITGTLAQVNAALAAVALVPTTNNDVDTTIATHIQDAAAAGPADGTITLDVTPVNDAPAFTKGADQVVSEDAPAQSVVGWASSISAGPGNESGQTLTFNVTNNSNPGLFSVAPSVAANGTLTYTLAANANGTAAITLALQDSGGVANGGMDTSAAQVFNITANAVNDAPTVADPLLDQGATAGMAFGYTFAAGSFSDVDAGDTLLYAATLASGDPLPAWLSFDAGTRSFSGTPAAGDAGLLSIRITATDSQSAAVSDVFELNVGSVINGTASNDTLNGTSGNDTINGLEGNDTLNGLDGNDILNGGIGTDTMNGGAGNDTILGAAGNDTLTGNAGNDSLDGGTGADSMQGGTGDDIYYVDAAGDVVTESAGQGTDTVNASIDYLLPANVENLALTGAALNATGNALANAISGNSAANTLDGRAGADILSGGAGDDIFAFRPGQSTGDSVLDFTGNGAAVGDSLRFTGFGAGATLTQIGATDSWQINYGAQSETIQLVGVTTLAPSDYLFV